VYAKVHNEGLRAGRGAGFTMPRRQFMGMHNKLNSAIIKALEKRLSTINKSL
jgi:phage gpG-like protein